MVVSVQFKDKNKVFKGRIYDYLLHKDDENEIQGGDIIRMMDKDYNFTCHGTRVKVVGLRAASADDIKNLQTIRCLKTTLD